MISPALKALRETYPSARIEIVARPHVHDCFLEHPWIDEVVLHEPNGRHRGPGGFIRFSRDLARRKYDVAVLFQKAFGAALMARLAGIPRRIGFDTDRRGFLLTDPIAETEEARRIHHVDYFLQVARAAGCDVNGLERRVYFHVDDDSRRLASRRLEEGNADRYSLLAAFAPGASKPPRAWHADRFAEIARHLATERGAGILVLGGPGDTGAARTILEAAGGRGIDATGRTTVREMAAIIEKCAIFIGNDSGPMHVAAALRIPILAFFGPGTPEKTAPYTDPERFIALTRRFPCSPCRQDFFKECEAAPSGKPMCLETITVDQARVAADDLLARQLRR